MILVLISAGGTAWVVHRAQVQREAVTAVEKAGGHVIYEWGRTPGAGLNPNGRPRGPRWLVDRVGVDYFGNVTLIFLGKRTTDADMEHLGRLSRLEGLEIANGSDVTDAGAAHLRGLEHLEHIGLSGSKVTGGCLANFRGLSRLKALMLADIPIADEDMANLKDLTTLEILDLSSTRVTDAGLAHLKALIKLRVLRLTSTRVSGAGLAHLRGMNQLRSLPLSRTRVVDLSALPTLPRLRDLGLDDTPIDDSQLAYLPGHAMQ